MTPVQVLVLTGFGLNCDVETAHAFQLAGARAHRVHINRLIRREVVLDDFQIMVFGGGFSWGDDHGAGVVQATRMKTRLGDNLLRFIERGRLVIGICNGFQTLVNLGLLPALGGDYRHRSVALTANDCGNFRNDWVSLKVAPATPCVFTRGLDRLELPVRHGEGKLVARADVIGRLNANGQVVLRYVRPNGQPAGGAFPHNPNGSVDDIAGICDPTGRVFGLMPHPEGHQHWTQHPDWPRRKEILQRQGHQAVSGPTEGLRILQNAVDFMHRG